jgi:hypothetical protein
MPTQREFQDGDRDTLVKEARKLSLPTLEGVPGQGQGHLLRKQGCFPDQG